MRLIIHDLSEEYEKKLKVNNDMVLGNDGTIKSCIGCFDCWTKHPVLCCLKDKYSDNPKNMQYMDEYVIITECYCGSYSPFIKNILDRSISYMLPFFVIRNDEMHHPERYSNKFKLTVYAYGNSLTEREKATMKSFVKANAINLNCDDYTTTFFQSPQDIISLWEGVKCK
ncbi:flavodoxin family protein [Alkaliphilus transvaalensis]|uniref:flavodoxin family protein n=1 Tax=Alkaliphilus transvaalensis TaxID=114628 RepID=UPI00047B0891|nr:flavodoxin family protein [Alkaliphilus transvaalensis]